MLKTISRTSALVAVLALGAISAQALAGGPPSDTPGASHRPATTTETTTTTTETTTTTTPTTTTTTPQPAPQGNAYGRACAGQSKTHVKGEKGTAFSRCVTAMAKLASGQTTSPRKACKTLSKKHVKGEKGTPFSRCVRAAAKLLKEKAAATS